MKIKITAFLIFYAAILCLSVNAQNFSGSFKDFSSKEISFSYPSNWKVTDKTASNIQQINLVPDTGNVLIMVLAYKPKVSTPIEFLQLKNQITHSRIESIWSKFSDVKHSNVCSEIGGAKFPGYKIAGLYGHEAAASESYSFVMGDKFFNLIYLTENKESSKANFAWETLMKTLKVKGKDSKKDEMIFDLEKGLILNSEAVELAKPLPSGSKAYYDKPIYVIATVDEKGDVISAKVDDVTTEVELVAIQAAKKSKFKPQYICGEPAKITGIIAYKLVRRFPSS